MKKMSRLLALCVALLIAVTACAFAENAAEEDPVLFTVGEKEYKQSEVDAQMQEMYNSSYVTSMADYDTAIEYLVHMAMIENKIKEFGLDQYTQEEEEAFLSDAQNEWDAAIDSYVSYFLTEDTEEARSQAKQEAENYYAAYGYSLDMLVEQLKWNDGLDKLQDKTVTVTEEEIKALYDAYVDQYKANFENNVPMYEYYQYYGGYDMLYTPEGYRSVIHILIEVDEALKEAYETAKVALEEQAEGTTEESAEEKTPVTQEDVDAALNAVLASRQKEIDDIYARLEKGETFESLIALYGTDPGMQDEATLKEGYHVHKDSMIYDPVFTAAAFSDKMQKPGDVSDPVVGSYGIHILYYLRDIPGGAVEMSDEMHETMMSNAAGEKFYDVLNGWAQESVSYNQENIDAAKAAALAKEAAAAEAAQAAETEEAEEPVVEEPVENKAE